jgi:hypothetical protein
VAHLLLILVSGLSARVGGQRVLGGEGRTRSCETSGGEDCKIPDEGNVDLRLVLVLKMWGHRDTHVAEQDLDKGLKRKKYVDENEVEEGVGVNENVSGSVSFEIEMRTKMGGGKGGGGESYGTGWVRPLRGLSLRAAVVVLRKLSEGQKHDHGAVADAVADDGASPEQPQKR